MLVLACVCESLKGSPGRWIVDRFRKLLILLDFFTTTFLSLVGDISLLPRSAKHSDGHVPIDIPNYDNRFLLFDLLDFS